MGVRTRKRRINQARRSWIFNMWTMNPFGAKAVDTMVFNVLFRNLSRVNSL